MHSKLSALVFVLFLFIVGCGSGDGGGTAGNSSEAVSTAQFVKQANAVCEKGLREKDEAVQQAVSETESGGSSSRSDLEGLVSEVVLPKLKKIEADLRGLNPPSKDVNTVGKILTKLEGAIEHTREDPGVMLDSNPFLVVSKEAARYGLTACQF